METGTNKLSSAAMIQQSANNRKRNFLKMKMTMNASSKLILLCALLTNSFHMCNGGSPGTEVNCPWYNDDTILEELKTGCVCAQNPPSSNQLSVQCHEVDGHQLVGLLTETVSKRGISIGLLYLNASFITDDKGQVPEKVFQRLRLISLQLSNCMIQSIHPNAFRGMEGSLKHLSLTQNQLEKVPTQSVNFLSNLLLLDLSFNKFSRVDAKTFQNLQKLSTLKLNDNSLDLDQHAFTGLEKSLKNLNLKGTRLSTVPSAIANLSTLAFLDLAQNRLRELEKYQFLNLHSLTALNLERNLLQSIPSMAFHGVNDTLSSLSLLNNLITYYPAAALKNLRELRVLDLGFNLLTEIPKESFKDKLLTNCIGLNSLTLLALDGNPLATLPEDAFLSINSTLRGISLGGRFLSCDCRLRWIFKWMKQFDLQVTSRERNPQFCGNPPEFRSLSFQQIKGEDLVCQKNETIIKREGSKQEIPLPKEVTLMSIDTPMAVLEFENTTGRDETNDSTTREDISAEVDSSSMEKPKAPVTEYHNPSTVHNSSSRFRFRRPRPRPKTTTAKPVFISSTERFLSNERRVPTAPDSHGEDSASESSNENGNNNAEEESKDTVEVRNTRITHDRHDHDYDKTRFYKPLPPKPSDDLNAKPTSLPFSSTTRRYPPVSLKTLRSFQQSNREAAARLTTSTATSVSVSTMTSSSTMSTNERNDEIMKVPLIRAKPIIPITITPKPVIINNQRSTVIRKVSIDTKDYDESKIPIISGVGPTRHNSEGSNNVVPIIKSPPPGSVQTQGVLVVQPQPSPNIPPSHNPSLGSPRSPSLIFAEKSDIILRDIQRSGESIMLRWESLKQLAGYRIIYRLFGEDTFRHGPPLAPTEREYRIKHVPFNECVVVCVVPYDDILYNDISPNAGAVPPGSQCRELKPTTPSVLMNHMDKITIGASAAICATVIIAVLLFIAITRRTKGKRSPSASTLVSKVPGSLMTPSPGPQGMTHNASMNLIKDWDQMSAVSARSIPRPRVYHGSLDHLASGPNHPHRQSMIVAQTHRSIPDGHSTHRSYLSSHHHHHNHSMHGYGHSNHHHGHHSNHHNNGFMHTQTRPVRASMMSVRSSHDILQPKPFTHGHHTASHRHYEQNHKRKRAGRPSQSESLNTLSGYDTPDNWTDHDMDVYVARNHARHDLVQL